MFLRYAFGCIPVAHLLVLLLPANLVNNVATEQA